MGVLKWHVYYYRGSDGQLQTAHGSGSELSSDRPIRFRQVAIVQIFIQVPPISLSVPPAPPIHALLLIPFVVKSHHFTSYFKEIILCVAGKNGCDGLRSAGGGSCC
jgi:hypothetical protein